MIAIKPSASVENSGGTESNGLLESTKTHIHTMSSGDIDGVSIDTILILFPAWFQM